MEVTKRTYQKHKTEKKITVKHYVNTAISHNIDNETTIYPLYVEVTYNRQIARFKSDIPAVNWFKKENNDFILDEPNIHNKAVFKSITGDFKKVIDRDINFITSIIQDQFYFNSDSFNINEVSKIYHGKWYTLSYFINWCLREEIFRELKNLDNSYFLNDDQLKSKHLYITQYSISDNITPLEHLEFYKKKYPDLELVVRHKYISHIWFVNKYIETIKLPSRLFYKSYSEKNIFASYHLTPNILDLQDNFIQNYLIDIFSDEKEAIEEMIYEINIFYNEKFEIYKHSVLSRLTHEVHDLDLFNVLFINDC